MAAAPFQKKTNTDDVSKIKCNRSREQSSGLNLLYSLPSTLNREPLNFERILKEVNMKLKKEYFILAAILVALILYLALHRSNRTNYQLPELSEVSGKHISKLEITTAGNSIIFNKKDNTWHIEPKGYRVDSTKVKNILDTGRAKPCSGNLISAKQPQPLSTPLLNYRTIPTCTMPGEISGEILIVPLTIFEIRPCCHIHKILFMELSLSTRKKPSLFLEKRSLKPFLKKRMSQPLKPLKN
jgi:hypothetical protein